MKVCVGGTFDGLHAGHRKLLETAFGVSSDVVVGLTSGAFAKKLRKRAKPYGQRLVDLQVFVQDRAKIVELNDRFGQALDLGMQAIVTSTETYQTALQANKKRAKAGHKPLLIVVIPILRDSKGRKISS